MKIAGSSFTMQAQHTYIQKDEQHEKLRTWVDAMPPHTEESPAAALQAGNADGYILELKATETAAWQSQQAHATMPEEYQDIKTRDDLKAFLVERLLEALTGKKVTIRHIEMPDKTADSASVNPQGAVSAQGQAEQAQQKQGWGVEYDRTESYEESESLAVSVEGVVKTTDGKEFNLSADFTVSRKFVQEDVIRLRAGDAKLVDPLVISLDGAPVRLTETKFKFDFNADGNQELISSLNSGSGFLAIDKNKDGVINDGSELFGPTTGNAFAELKSYDDDGNGWIDENDVVFKNLRIWSKDPQGNDRLATLKANDVGAIYLNSITTPFTIKDSANSTQGQVGNSSIYVTEHGKAGILQNIDFAV
ncbi:MAG TPA: hypothetical protein VGK02_01355 [Candidatus Aquicultor sp.]